MLCQNCNKAQATCHYKQTINGETHEAHLCAECAEKLGYGSMFNFNIGELGFGLDSMLSHMFGQGKKQSALHELKCPLCGATAEDISRTGRVGCAECYDVFSDMLTPYIRRIHGNTAHVGRIPVGADEQIGKNRKIEQLKADMQKAIEAQEFERAAELRDEIKGLENNEG